MMNPLIYPLTNPVVFSIGPITGNWYGLWFEAGLLMATVYCRWLINKTRAEIKRDELSFLIFIGGILTIAGSRVGYVLTAPSYDLSTDPYAVLRFWEGGTSLYGALIATTILLAVYARATGKSFLCLSDIVAPAGFIAVMAASAGDISNGVHWGSVSPGLPWGVLFPLSHQEDAILSVDCSLYRSLMGQNGLGLLPRHPLQIYEFLLGLLFTMVVSIAARMKTAVRGYTTCVFLLCCGVYKILSVLIQTETAESLFDPSGNPANALLLGAIVFASGLCFLQIVSDLNKKV